MFILETRAPHWGWYGRRSSQPATLRSCRTCGSRQVHYSGVTPNDIGHRKLGSSICHFMLLCKSHNWLIRVITRHGLHLLEKWICLNGICPLAVLISLSQMIIDHVHMCHPENSFATFKKVEISKLLWSTCKVARTVYILICCVRLEADTME